MKRGRNYDQAENAESADKGGRFSSLLHVSALCTNIGPSCKDLCVFFPVWIV